MTEHSATLWRVLGAFEDNPRKCGGEWQARCPAHEDRHASLSIGMGLDGRVLVNCHAGCPAERIVSALGLSLADLFERSAAGNPVRRFRLLDTSGSTVAVHVREDVPGGKKLWWESHGKTGLNGTPLERLPLYRLPDVLAADVTRPVIVCEGEKAADALAELGLLAVGTVTGASSTPGREALAPLEHREVWLWPDNDDLGRAHMQRIARSLERTRWVEWTDAPLRGDAADYVAAGGTADGVLAMLRQEPLGSPSLVTLRPYMNIAPEEIHWLWPGRIALGKLTVLMGDPGLGKSLLTVHAASVVSTGGTWPDGEQCQQGAVIILTAEDGPADTVRPRLDAAGADVSRVFELQSIKDKPEDEMGRMFQLATDIGALELAIRETGAKLVILDPLNAYLGGVDSHKAAEVRGVLAPLATMADRTGVALLVLHHLNKGTSANALYRAGGSLDFVAAARSVLGVVPDPDQPERRLLVSVKINIAVRPAGLGYRITSSDPLRASSAPIITWDNLPVTVDPLTAFAESTTPEDRWQRQDIRDVLGELLRNGDAPADVIKAGIRGAGITASEKLLRSVAHELGVKIERRGFGPGGQWIWRASIDGTTTKEVPSMPSMGNQVPSMVFLGTQVPSMEGQVPSMEKSIEGTSIEGTSVYGESIEGTSVYGERDHRRNLDTIDGIEGTSSDSRARAREGIDSDDVAPLLEHCSACGARLFPDEHGQCERCAGMEDRP